MKKWLLAIMTILIFSILTGCGKEKEEEALPEILDVKLSVTPEKGKPNEPVKFEAKVTYGEEKVSDGDVSFEIWRAHDEHHEKVEIEHVENGIYRLEKTFEKEGTYYIISHVTAKSMHSMPKKEFVIGQPSEPETEPQSTEMDMDEHTGGSGH